MCLYSLIYIYIYIYIYLSASRTRVPAFRTCVPQNPRSRTRHSQSAFRLRSEPCVPGAFRGNYHLPSRSFSAFRICVPSLARPRTRCDPTLCCVPSLRSLRSEAIPFALCLRSGPAFRNCSNDDHGLRLQVASSGVTWRSYCLCCYILYMKG